MACIALPLVLHRINLTVLEERVRDASHREPIDEPIDEHRVKPSARSCPGTSYNLVCHQIGDGVQMSFFHAIPLVEAFLYRKHVLYA